MVGCEVISLHPSPTHQQPLLTGFAGSRPSNWGIVRVDLSEVDETLKIRVCDVLEIVYGRIDTAHDEARVAQTKTRSREVLILTARSHHD